MDYEKLREMDSCNVCSNDDPIRRVALAARLFEDKYRDVWIRVCTSHVRRYSDGNYGGWFKGAGFVTFLSTLEDNV